MKMELNMDPTRTVRRTDGHLLCLALFPFFFLCEGARRAVGRLKRDTAPLTLRSWFAEAKSQASIATSYALLAKSMLQ
jgi:hypothetical protein